MFRLLIPCAQGAHGAEEKCRTIERMFRLLIPCAQERTELRKNVEPYNVSTFDEIGWGVSMNKNYEKLMRCYESLREKVKFEPKVAIVLGSGL